MKYREILSNASLSLLFLIFFYVHLQVYLYNPRASLLLICVFEAVLVVLAFVRRPAQAIKTDWKTYFVTGAGTFAALLFRPDANGVDSITGQVLQVVGGIMQLLSAISLWRSFGLLPANRGIQTSGMYRLVRHPLYFSYIIAHTGYLINNPTIGNIVIAVFALTCQITRIRMEEQILLALPEYEKYTHCVRWRLVPMVW